MARAEMTEPAFTIGGSDAASACGLDPYRSRIMLVAEKLGMVEREPSEAMRWGTLLEPVIVAQLHADGYETVPAPADGWADIERPWLVGHLDGFAVLDDARAVLEVKTGSGWAGHDWNGNRAPARYVIQCQHYLHLTELPRALLAVLIGGQRLEVRTVERDDELIAAMIEAETETMGFLNRGELPPPDGSDSAAEVIRALHPDAIEGKTCQLHGESWEAFQDLKRWRAAEDRAKSKRAELEQVVKFTAGDADTILSPGGSVVARWANVTRNAINTTRLKKEAPHIAATYTDTTNTRRFTLA